MGYDDDQGGGIPGWLWFILIYGGVNLILHLLGVPLILIPLPRR